MQIARALSIAGSDSGGGAGIQADLKTFSALGVFGMTAITAVTAQNTARVTAIAEISPDVVASQIDAVASDIGVDAAKTGMLSSGPIIAAVAQALIRNRIAPVVVDPVMISKAGAPLLREDAVEVLRRTLLPLARVVTPNLHEAAALTGRTIRTVAEMEEAAEAIAEMGPRAVVVKGGHLVGEPVDILYDGGTITRLRAARVPTGNTHGTGCVFSAAITAYLAQGEDVGDAVRAAKVFISRAIEAALPLGRGHGPADPMHATAATGGRAGTG